MSKILPGAVSVGALLLAALPLAGHCEKPATPANKPAASAPTESAMRAYVDPETGGLVDHPVTDKQRLDATKAMPAPDLSKVTEIHHADGTIEVQLNGQFEESVVAHVDAHGNRHIQCNEAGHHHEQEQSTDATAQETRDDR
jgi:hypothetical protein